jgi:hypothetical protein
MYASHVPCQESYSTSHPILSHQMVTRHMSSVTSDRMSHHIENTYHLTLHTCRITFNTYHLTLHTFRITLHTCHITIHGTSQCMSHHSTCHITVHVTSQRMSHHIACHITSHASHTYHSTYQLTHHIRMSHHIACHITSHASHTYHSK